MKLTFGIIIFFVFQAIAVVSQNTVASIDVKNMELDRFLTEIERQTSVKFLYRYENVEGKTVTVSMENAPVEEVLDAALRNKGLKYSKMGNNLIVIAPIATQQNRKITGKITDESGISIPGVSVSLKGTSSGTISDSDGNYSVVVPDNESILKFSFVGFESQEIVVTNQMVINVVLKESKQAIDEVVVTALGIERNKRTLAYATQQVGMDAVTTVKDISLGNALAGKIAGVNVTSSSGATGVGSGTRIIIRGERSINGNNTPLIVMDGVPSDFGLDAINPDDVESINVLKGPAASALYGSSAANGVIVVTTKKGKSGRTDILVNSSTSFDVPYLYPPLQNVYSQGVGGVYNANSDLYSWGAKMQGQTVTDWTGKEVPLNPQPNNVKDLFRDGYNLTNSLSYSTGSEKSTAYFSYTNITAGGLLPVNNLERHNFNLRLETELIKNLKLDFNITWLRSKTENSPSPGDDLFSPMWQLLKMPRSIRTADIIAASYYDETGSLKQLTWSPQNTAVINPYWSMYGRDAIGNGSNVNALTSMKYNVTPWLYVQLRGRLAYNNSDSEEKLYWDTQYVNSGQGKYSRSYSKSQLSNADFLLGVDKDLTTDWHLSANFGGEIKDNQGSSISSSTGKLVIENKFFLQNGETINTSDSEYHTQTQSLYGTFQIGYKNYLFLDATGRNDWNSTLPAPYDYFYPSVGLTGVVSDMFKMPEIISFFKLRGSYAEVGNGAGFAAIYQTLRRSVSGSVGEISTSSTKVPTNLIPEKTKAWEAGTEFRLFRDRFGVDFSWYKTNTYNQLMYVTSAPSSGYGTAAINAGNIQNTGVELTLTGIPIKTPLFKWDMKLNFNRNWSKVLELTSTLDQYQISAPNLSIGDTWVMVGKPYGEMYSRGFVRNANGDVIVDAQGLPKITPDYKTYLGNFHYDWQSSFINNFRYKNWMLYFMVDLNYGGVRQSASEAQMMGSGTSKATLYGRDGFVYPGVKEVTNEDGSVSYVPNDIQITAELYGKAIGGRASNGAGEPFNHSATNSRLREMSIGYSFPIRNSVVKSLVISAVGRNLFYLYNGCTWFDPDVTYNTDTNGQGAESAFLPGARNIGFNIKLGL